MSHYDIINIIINVCMQSMCDKHERKKECTTIYETTRRFQSESFSEMSSICSYPCEHCRFDVLTSADETTDNNVDIS